MTNNIKTFVRKRLGTFSQTPTTASKCPKCNSSPCKCGEIATHSEVDLSSIKSELIDVVSKLGIDEQSLSDIKSNILASSKEKLISMLEEELKNGEGSDKYKDTLDKFKSIKDKLSTNCGEQKTYSEMSDKDMDARERTKAELDKLRNSVTNLPELKEGETGVEFLKRCINWAKKADKCPEPALYDELVKLGKEYGIEIND